MEAIRSVCDKLSSTQLSDGSTFILTPVSMSPKTRETLENIGDSEKAGNLEESVKELCNTWEGDGDECHWDSWESTETPEYVDSITQLQKVQDEVKQNWSSRNETSRYTRVIVLLLSWEEHDLGDLDEAQRQFQTTFECLYKYDVWRFKIPMKKPHLALTKKLVELANTDSSENLYIIWYDGHGNEHEDQRGSPRWCSHGDVNNTSTVDSSIISTTLADCEADILLVNNSCRSLTCGRFGSKGIVESISASAFSTTTYGSSKPDDLSLSMSWAALRILRDRKSVEEGITVTEFHRQICLAVQWAGGDHPDYDEVNIESPIFWRPRDIRTQPVYTRLSAEAVGAHGRTRSIVLRQLNSTMQSWEGYMYKPDLQIQLQVINVDEIDSKKWADWILSAPPDVLTVRLEKPESNDDNTA